MEILNTIFNEIEKIASSFNIKEADNVVLTFKKDFGILKFKNAADQNATAADPYNPLPSSQAAPAIPQDPTTAPQPEQQNLDNSTQQEVPKEEVKTEEKKPEEEKQVEIPPEVKAAIDRFMSKYESPVNELKNLVEVTKQKFSDPNMDIKQLQQETDKEAQGFTAALSQAAEDPDYKLIMEYDKSGKQEKPEQTQTKETQPQQPQLAQQPAPVTQEQPTTQQPVVPA